MNRRERRAQKAQARKWKGQVFVFGMDKTGTAVNLYVIMGELCAELHAGSPPPLACDLELTVAWKDLTYSVLTRREYLPALAEAAKGRFPKGMGSVERQELASTIILQIFRGRLSGLRGRDRDVARCQHRLSGRRTGRRGYR